MIATRAAIAPFPTMPMSSVFWVSLLTAAAAITPDAQASCVTRTTSGKRPSSAPSAARVEPEPAEPEDQHAETEQGHRVPGIGRGLPSPPYLPFRAPSNRSTARPPDAPIRWTAVETGEVLHADVRLQPTAAEHPVT